MENRPPQRVTLEMVSFFGIQEVEPDIHREKYQAQLQQKAEDWFITFQEEQGSTLMKISEGEVTVIRRGQVTMRQLFRPGTETSGTYISPAGKMLMETRTHEVVCENNREGRLAQIMWRYDLRLNGQEIGQNRVTCKIEFK